ncbi:MAG: hypothetical protein ACHQM6_02375 [Candidatus Kapaibacterium sp.]
MKKQYSILSMMFALTLSFFLVSCGAKKDEALVTEFNSKKTDADKMVADMTDHSKTMMADHAAWSAKLDSAGKLPGADMAKIGGFKDAMKKMEDQGKSGSAIMDSLKSYGSAKTETNDQLKAAIAGLDANMAAAKSMGDMMMDAHKKLGDDITAFLGGGAPAASAEPAKAEEKGGKKTSAKTVAPPADAPKMDMTKHDAPPAKPGGTPRRGSGAVIK